MIADRYTKSLVRAKFNSFLKLLSLCVLKEETAYIVEPTARYSPSSLGQPYYPLFSANSILRMPQTLSLSSTAWINCSRLLDPPSASPSSSWRSSVVLCPSWSLSPPGLFPLVPSPGLFPRRPLWRQPRSLHLLQLVCAICKASSSLGKHRRRMLYSGNVCLLLAHTATISRNALGEVYWRRYIRRAVHSAFESWQVFRHSKLYIKLPIITLSVRITTCVVPPFTNCLRAPCAVCFFCAACVVEMSHYFSRIAVEWSTS
jgi:hypothetical protein